MIYQQKLMTLLYEQVVFMVIFKMSRMKIRRQQCSKNSDNHVTVS